MEKSYNLLYKVGYRHSKMWKYEVFPVKARTLSEAKAKIKKTHPKATTLVYDKKVT